MPIVTREVSTVSDCHRLAATMRAKDQEELRALGGEPMDILLACYRDGIMQTSYFVDGELAAMSGLGFGPELSLLSDKGRPYLLTAPAVERAPVAFLKEARRAVGEMLSVKHRLEGEVLADYHGAVRLLQAIGFVIGDIVYLGPRKTVFLKYHMER